MIQTICVREFARLTTGECDATLDRAQVSISAFDHLCQLSASFSKSGASLIHVEGRRWLRLDNYVGVIQTPCGTAIEILPKNHQEGDSISACRALLRKMVRSLLDLPSRTAAEADLERFQGPLTEWVMKSFLAELDILIKRGVRSDYRYVEDELPYLRGQLNVARQLRQAPGRGHYFQTRHATYEPDRPENRLLRLALDKVRQSTADPDSWRLAQELSDRLCDIRPSVQKDKDFRAWSSDRLMAHYRPIKPWCEIILSNSMPMALAGDSYGMSLLFPMEKLFERYVANWLRKQLPEGLKLKVQASTHALCEHQSQPVFQLEPDLLVFGRDRRWVLDTKWKRLNEADRANKYGLSQGDFYQMLAYGSRYMNAVGDMALIYPKSSSFNSPLSSFTFSKELAVHVLPFDLTEDLLLGWERLGWAESTAQQIISLVPTGSSEAFGRHQ